MSPVPTPPAWAWGQARNIFLDKVIEPFVFKFFNIMFFIESRWFDPKNKICYNGFFFLFQQLKFLTAMELTTLLWMGRSSRDRESITERHFLALIFSSLKAKEVEIQASDFQKQIMFVHSTSLISKITIMMVLFYYRIVI